MGKRDIQADRAETLIQLADDMHTYVRERYPMPVMEHIVACGSGVTLQVYDGAMNLLETLQLASVNHAVDFFCEKQ